MGHFFPQKIDVDISCKLSPYKIVCLKCQNFFFPIKTSGADSEGFRGVRLNAPSTLNLIFMLNFG